MPTGPKGEKRPADVVGNAVRVAEPLVWRVTKLPHDVRVPALVLWAAFLIAE